MILFVLTIAEALPVLGVFIPGHLIVMFGGFLAYLGILRLDAVIVVALLGSVIGDLLAYIIGWKFGHDFIMRYGRFFFFNQARYEKTKILVQEHAGKTLIMGRFGSFARAVSAFIAGTSKIKFSKFILFAVLGGIVWSGSAVLIGYIFGQSFETASKYFGRFILAAVIVIIFLIIGYRLLNKRKHVFARFHVFYLILNGLSVYIFSKMAEDYFDKESTFKLDYWLDGRIHLLWQPWLNKLMVFITDIFQPAVLFSVILAASFYLLIKKKLYQAIFIFLGAGGGLVLGAVAKRLIGRPRPTGGFVLESGFSFPSQHSLMAIIFFTLILFFYLEKIHRRWLKYLFISSNLFLIFLVSFSRIYLKVHWFSDLLAGLALGLFWLTFLILVFRIIDQLASPSSKLFKFIKKNSPE